MAVNNTQYLSFLGGLVSPRLWLRSDMDKFGKWFATTDNIRFHTVGSFENRFGTVKIGNTYRNQLGENIKLIKFDFGQGETCMLELGSGYFRVIANGKYILDENDVPLVFNTQIVLSDTDDIKYVQSGDIIFLTNRKGIYEIKRLSKDFTQWEITPFAFSNDIVVYSDENDDNLKTITGQNYTITTSKEFKYSFPIGEDGIYRITDIRVQFFATPSGGAVYTSASNEWFSLPFFVSDIASIASSVNLSVSLSGNVVTFTDAGYTSVYKIRISFRYMKITNKSYVTQDGGRQYVFNNLEELYSIKPYKYRYANNSNVVVSFRDHTSYFSNGYDVTPLEFYVNDRSSIDNMLYSLNNNILSHNMPEYGTSLDSLNILLVKTSNNSLRCVTKQNVTGSYNYNSPDGNWNFDSNSFNYNTCNDLDGNIWLRNDCEYKVLSPFEVISEITPVDTSATYFTVSSSNFNFFSNKQNGETFMIRHIINAGYIHFGNGQYTSTESATGSAVQLSIKSNGFWRYNSSGLWTGKVELQYSTDNGTTWVTFFTRKNTSHTQYSTTNDNTSGNIKTEGITILLRMVCTITGEDEDAKFSAELAVDKFEVNSVYKIYDITENNTATVECVKGDIGEFTNNSHWREAEFSKANGYPTAIGFYQNRLFLGKEYKLYSSRINDFWDFYEPIEVADDDPMTMSLLSYKVNNIQNLIGIRSFFVFTSGGEFGIGAEGGALTQATKYLKQISAHGSNSCNPIFCGDIIVFVDKTNNTVRAFRYSLEADGWEATDVSVLIEQVLEGKKIVTTEYMQDTKECLFLTDEGEVYVFKFFQEQNIAAWSVWKHAKYKITNLCVLEDSLGKDILYIAVNTNTGMQIEQFNPNYYCDSVETFSNETEFDSVTTTFQEGDEVVVNDGTDLYLAEVGENGVVSLRNDSTYATVGLSYTSTATLLSPEIQDRDGTFSTFNRKRPFKVHCFYRNSYGFKVGVEEENKQEPQWQPIWSTADEETSLTTGKTSVLIPARYDGSSRVSFVQDKPYPMIIENVLLETDYGGK